MQASDLTNDALVARYLQLFESPGSKKVRAHRLSQFFKFIGNKALFTLEYDDYMNYFLALKRNANLKFSYKQNSWAIVKSFVEFVQEYANKFINFPKKMAKWGNGHGKAEGKAITEVSDLDSILERARAMDYKRFVELTLLKDAGMRPGELVTIKINNLHLDDRYVISGTEPGAMKSGEVEYSFSEKCQAILKNYLNSRLEAAKDNPVLKANPFLFPDRSQDTYDGIRSLQILLTQIRGNSKITPHSFRTIINTLRKKAGCPPEDRKFLINQNLDDVNAEHYVKLSREEKLALYDKWYPY